MFRRLLCDLAIITACVIGLIVSFPASQAQQDYQPKIAAASGDAELALKGFVVPENMSGDSSAGGSVAEHMEQASEDGYGHWSMASVAASRSGWIAAGCESSSTRHVVWFSAAEAAVG